MEVTLSSLIPFYFAMKWFRSEMRFFVTSMLIFAGTLFPFEVIILLLARASDSDEIDKAIYQRALFIEGIVCFVFLGVLFAFFKNTHHLPNAMSTRELDPIKRGLRLAFTSWKLVVIIFSNLFNFYALIFIFRKYNSSIE